MTLIAETTEENKCNQYQLKRHKNNLNSFPSLIKAQQTSADCNGCMLSVYSGCDWQGSQGGTEGRKRRAGLGRGRGGREGEAVAGRGRENLVIFVLHSRPKLKGLARQ